MLVNDNWLEIEEYRVHARVDMALDCGKELALQMVRVCFVLTSASWQF